jgi:hypothetical protein
MIGVFLGSTLGRHARRTAPTAIDLPLIYRASSRRSASAISAFSHIEARDQENHVK